jgi:hypothetical protein
MRAAEIGTNNGAVLAASVEAGANMTETRGVCGDSALHSWAQIPSECLDYPKSYPYVMDVIFQKMVNASLRNDMQESPLHMVTSTESSNEQFIQMSKHCFQKSCQQTSMRSIEMAECHSITHY